jgi:hypothetical protein
MSEGKREEILSRIREALRVPARRHASGLHSDKGPGPASNKTVREWLPAVPVNAGSRLALFLEKSIELKTDVHVVKRPEALSVLMRLRDNNHWTSVAAHRHPLIDPLVPALGLETVYVEQRPDPESL